MVIRPFDGDLCFFGFAGKRRFYDLLDSSGQGRTRFLSHGFFGAYMRVILRTTLSFRWGRGLFKNAQVDHAPVSQMRRRLVQCLVISKNKKMPEILSNNGHSDLL